jgi:UDP-glucose 4-epimerase
MTVLVTGGAGYIGSHMVHRLRDAGEQVIVLDNLSTGFRWLLPGDVPLFMGETGDESLVNAIIAAHDVRDVIHFAASIVVPDSVADPLGYYKNNTANARTLIEAAVKGGVRHFIFSSTAAVYGTPKSLPVIEDAPLNPESPYGASKLMTEIILRDACAAHDMKHAILRYFNVAGADPAGRVGQSTPNATHLIKVGVQAALGLRNGMDVFGIDYATPDGTCLRDYIHVSDLVAAHSAALSYLRDGGASRTFNCGYGRGYSVLEVIDTVKRVTGVDFPVTRSPRRPGDAAAVVAGNHRILSELQWKPELDKLETIVEHAVAWERKLMGRNAPDR